ncbi:MAG: MFS transporter [Isosphaera sp.]|nr:MFS transporter [Isosphaera sp.]
MARPANPWVVAAVVTVPAVLEMALLTIAGTSTAYIVGGLGGSPDDGFWVGNAYMGTVGVAMAVSGWFSDRLGRKRFLLPSLAGFALFTALCGLASGMYELILYRTLQGVAGGGIVPAAQGVILDAFPKDRQAVPLALYGAGCFAGIFAGPALGGYLTDALSWRWVFLVAVPPAVLSLAAVALVVHDPPALRARRAVLLSRPVRFDYAGLALIAVGIVSLQTFVGKGQEWDWFRDPFGRVQACFAGAVAGLGLALYRELRAAEPLVDLRPFADRHFAASALAFGFGYALLYGSSAALGPLLASLFGYTATWVGVVQAPAAVVGIPALLVVIWLIARGVDGRWLMLAGLVVLVGGFFWMSRMTVYLSPGEVATPRAVQVFGLILVLIPCMSTAYQSVPRDQVAAAAGLFSFLRFTGGAVGTALGATLLERRGQFHTQRLGEGWDALDPRLREAHDALAGEFLKATGDPAAAGAMAWDWLNTLRDNQALSLAAFDVYWVGAWAALGLLVLIAMMRGPPAPAGG